MNGKRQPHAKNSASLEHAVSATKMPGRAEEAERRAELRKHAVPGALAAAARSRSRAAPRRPIRRRARALTEAAEREQRGRGDADRGVGRQQADRDRREPHREQRCDERRFAADAVAEVAEQRGADRPRDERDRERRERLQRRGRRVAGREEQLREHEHGGRAVDVEIEELDRRADQAREQHSTFRQNAAPRAWVTRKDTVTAALEPAPQALRSRRAPPRTSRCGSWTAARPGRRKRAVRHGSGVAESARIPIRRCGVVVGRCSCGCSGREAPGPL